MSAPLQIERLDIERWGRASGFDLDLSAGNFLVLFGPNESGKSSVATALAWLIAGPGTQGVLQRFGAEKETLQAHLRGRLGPDLLTVEVSARVTSQRPGTSVRENFGATVGGVALNRAELIGRLGGGDFTGYQRLYWVEALTVADGEDLQENVSVQAVFGGVNPFQEADGLDAKALEYVGGARGRAREGSARDLHDRVRRLNEQLRALPDTKAEWGRIERELAAENRELEQLRPKIRALEGELCSVKLAGAAISDGLVAARAAAHKMVSDAMEPSPFDRRLHEQASLVRAKIGELEAAERQVISREQQHETAHAALDHDWRPLVTGIALGEAGISEVATAETRLRVCLEDLATAEEAEADAASRHGCWKARDDELSDQWSQQAPGPLTPEACALFDADFVRANRPDALTVGAMRRPDRTGNLARSPAVAALVLGIAVTIMTAVFEAVQGHLIAFAVAGVGAAAMLAALVHFVRSESKSAEAPDPALVVLAKRLLEVRAERDDAAKHLTNVRGQVAKQGRRTGRIRQEYRKTLTALAVPGELAERFEQGAGQHLGAVREVQLAATELAAKRKAMSDHLKEVRMLLAGAVDDAAVAAPRNDMDIGQVDVSSRMSAVARDDEVPMAPDVAPPIEVEDAAEAESVLAVACERVELHMAAAVALGDAEDSLKRAVQFNDTALGLVEQSSADELRTRVTELEAELGNLETNRETVQDEIARLAAARKGIEAPDDQRVDMILQREKFLVHVDEAVVRGLAHHLAAHLLREAAERHRTTQQPKLLQRTREFACDVAGDWYGITVNPRASTGGKGSELGDNLLVDSPRGEYSARRLSHGAQSLLYLTLRLATIEEQSKTRGVRLPLLLDDVLVGLDDERAERCVQVLAEFSASHQLLLLTCHERTAERAQSAGAEILEIAPR